MLLSLSDLIVKSWQLYIKHWRTFALYIFFLFLPTAVLALLGILGVYLDGVLPQSSPTSNLILAIVFVASLVFSFWVSIALTQVSKDITVGQNTPPWRVVFNGSAPLIWPFLYTSALVGLVVMGGTILFIIPGIIFTIWFSFAAYAVMLNGQRGVAALRASKALVVGRWWPVALRVALPALFFTVVAVLIRSLVLMAIFFVVSSQFAQAIITHIITALTNALVTPLTVTAGVLLYTHLLKTPISPVISPESSPPGTLD